MPQHPHISQPADDSNHIEDRIVELMSQMSLAEKIGQMSQLNASEGYAPEYLGDALRAGRVGSVLNVVELDIVNELQRIAVAESRLGIPLLVGRDVIHGFKTILPIPLGQAATWNPELVEKGASMAAREAATTGVNWTFAPMLDISRDPRWGRIAESCGESVYLTSKMATAMVQGFQGNDLRSADSIAACAKHFAGYGAVESGRDYATTNIPENELRNVYLPPFHACVDAGVATLMTSFSDVNGRPATANDLLLRQILRDEWSFDGLVVSDWDSVRQLQIHGLTEDDKESAFEAVTAGVDMEMAGDAFSMHLQHLVEENRVSLNQIDSAVANILRVKFRLGLFESPYSKPEELPKIANDDCMVTAKETALQSVVLLKNDHGVLPLCKESTKSLAVIGPLADARYEQLGTWIFDGDEELSVTPLQAIHDLAGDDIEIHYSRAMDNSRSKASDAFDHAVATAEKSDAVLLFLGEESILSGEAHSRADINLPGDQEELVRRIRATGRPLIVIVLAGRPLTLTNIIDQIDALLFAWHPGTMGGPAIADLIFGLANPSGKLPVTFPRVVGQIPIYYSQKNGGKPATRDNVVHIDDIDTFAPQTSLGMSSFHLDTCFTPLFEFGFGLTYTNFHYENLQISATEVSAGDTVMVSVDLVNTGGCEAVEVVQLYTRDVVASITRPVKELKDFRRVSLEPGEKKTVEFSLDTNNLSFYGRDMRPTLEPGVFHVWLGGSSQTNLSTEFRLV